MNRVERYDYITKDAKSDDEIITALEWVRFHYFNPNGLYQQAKDLSDSAYEYVKAGKANYGIYNPSFPTLGGKGFSPSNVNIPVELIQ